MVFSGSEPVHSEIIMDGEVVEKSQNLISWIAKYNFCLKETYTVNFQI
jgi:hypothetical protein